MSPPFLRACPKYASKSYSSCASHILSFCFINVPSFIEISLTVFKLQSGHEIVWKIIKGNNSKDMKARVMILVHDTLSHLMLYKCTTMFH